MLYRKRTDRGRIKFDENIIGTIAMRAIEATGGRALPAGAKGRRYRGGQSGGANDDRVVDVVFKGGALDVKIYIIVRFGSSISRVCKDIDASFRSETPAITGLDVGELTIYVKGLLSKNISKRNIEVTTHAGDISGS